MPSRKLKKPIQFIKREQVVLTKELKTKCEDKVRQVIGVAKELWGVELEMPFILYDLKSLTAGMTVGSSLLRLHPIFLNENEQDYVTETVPHEVAHLLVPLVGPKLRAQWIKDGKMSREESSKKFMSHGAEWKAIMVALGVGPKPGKTWKEVIKSFYNPSSIEMKPRKKNGPRKPGGRKVGEILLKIKGLKPHELQALKDRLGFEVNIGGEPPPPSTKEEIQAGMEMVQLKRTLLSDFTHMRPRDTVSLAGWAHNVINELKGK